jgi:hypothetical protein
MKRGFKYTGKILSERGLKRLAGFLADRASSVKGRLGIWLGEEVKITGKADPGKLLYTLTFIDLKLGPVGQADLIFAGKDVLPSDVRFRVYAGQAGDACTAPGSDPCIEERKAMMKRISEKTEELFIQRVLWRVSYHSGGELIGTKEIIDIDADMTRVKTKAYDGAPPGTDMIKLVTPDGKALFRTEKKHWVRGLKGVSQAAQPEAGLREATE